MQTTRRVAALIAAAALGLPSGALAQSAGDNQYQDPLGNNQSSSGTSHGSSSGSSSSGRSSSSGSSSSGSSASSSSPSSTGSSAGQLTGMPPGSSGSGQIPRTGGEPIEVALLGMGLVLAGVGLRLRLRRPVG